LSKKDDELIHFCHGATGSVSMLLQAYKVFDEEEYLTAALKAG
jgi:lantibiotic modifying enzyme